MGRLITCTTAIDAKPAIWICSEPSAEHVAALPWLNQSSPAAFYLVKIEAVRIGDSRPAPLLAALIAGSIKEAKILADHDLGAEALRRLRVQGFPAIVINDVYGGDAYEAGRKRYREQFDEAC